MRVTKCCPTGRGRACSQLARRGRRGRHQRCRLAGHIFDDNGLTERCPHLLRHNAPDHISATAGSERHDNRGRVAKGEPRKGIARNQRRRRTIPPALTYSPWFGLFAPRGTPRDIIDKLNGAAVDALTDPAVRSRFLDLGLDIFPRDQQTSGPFVALVKSDIEKWRPIIKEANIKVE
jgi:hypothetical protein